MQKIKTFLIKQVLNHYFSLKNKTFKTFQTVSSLVGVGGLEKFEEGYTKFSWTQNYSEVRTSESSKLKMLILIWKELCLVSKGSSLLIGGQFNLKLSVLSYTILSSSLPRYEESVHLGLREAKFQFNKVLR